jgi:hypothetical protein
MVRRRSLAPLLVAALAAIVIAIPQLPASAQGDVEVTVGSPNTPFSQNKQNEPAVAIDANHPSVLASGANDNIDMEACAAGDPTTCPFTEGVGVSGITFSFDEGTSWMQPEYEGLSARNCLGPDECVPETGPIGTLPGYDTAGLVADGDPALAFGPVPKNGTFSWANGSRLYYANLTSNLPGSQAFKGFEAIAVSRIDGPADTGLTEDIVSNQDNWMPPVIASKQNSALFSDKEQVWADNAESSPFFGNAYVCYAGFGGAFGQGFTPQPLYVLTSTDGGDSWTQKKVTNATNNINTPNGFGRSGCTIRTDSLGTVYAFVYQFAFDAEGSATGTIQMIRSFNGGATWKRPVNLFDVKDGCEEFEPSIGRCVMDGVAGARDDLMSVPSVDIANGAPSGEDATDQIVLATTEQQALNDENVLFTTSTDGGDTWTDLTDITQGSDRGYYSAPAISPNGTDVWVVYNAFTTPFRDSAVGAGNDRQLVGVVLHADVDEDGVVGDFDEVHRGASGDARSSSQNNLAAEFLGDYVYAAATRDYGAAVWNDVREGADCPAIDEYRQDLHDEAVATGTQTAEPEEPRGAEEFLRQHGKTQEEEPEAPNVEVDCPANFGNSDIWGIAIDDPTPAP